MSLYTYVTFDNGHKALCPLSNPRSGELGACRFKRKGKYVTFDPKLVIGDEPVPCLLDKNGGFFKAVGRSDARASRQREKGSRLI